MAIEKNIDILKALICRDEPTLLGYIPSYKGKLKRRETEGKPSKQASEKIKKGGVQQKGRSQQLGGSKKAKEPRVKFLTLRKTADFWFQESRVTDIPGINTPLQTLLPEFAEEMPRRNVVRVNIRDGAVVRQKETDLTEPAEKRQKVTCDFFSTKPTTPHSSEKEQTESSTASGSKGAQKDLSLAGPVVV